MTQTPYNLPPFSEPHALISGVELIASKLPRNGVPAAAQHLRAILGEHNGQHRSDPLVPV